MQQGNEPSITLDTGRTTAPVPFQNMAGEVRPIQSDRGGLTRTLANGSMSVVGVFLLLVLLEFIIPTETAKPSYVLGSMSGRTEAARLKAEADAKAAYDTQLREVEAHYQEKIAVINANAQNIVNGFQAEMTRVNSAYESLFKQALVAQQYGMQADAEMARIRAQVAANNSGVNSFFASLCDFAAGVSLVAGDSRMASAAYGCSESMRGRVSESITRAGTSGTGAYYNQVRGNSAAEEVVSQHRADEQQRAKARREQDKRNAAALEDVMKKY